MYIVLFLMGLLVFFIILSTKTPKAPPRRKVSRQEVDTIVKNVQVRIAKANGSITEHYSMNTISAQKPSYEDVYKDAVFINRDCTDLEQFIINDDINEYDLIKLAELNGIGLEINKGWYLLAIKLIKELNEQGWNKKVTCIKEKYASLRFYTGGEYHAIADKYERISEHVCETCGQEGIIRYNTGWEYVACRKHYLENRGRIQVKDGGFIFNGQAYTWDDVVDMQFEDIGNDKRYKFLTIKCHKNTVQHAGWTDNKIYVSKGTIGYGNFLTHINSQYRSLTSTYIENFSTVDFCEVCGYKSVYFGECECCENETFESYKSNTWSSTEESEKEYIKRNQLGWAEDCGEIYEQQYKTYYKNPDYKLLYTDEELEAYTKDIPWEDEG